ncbi:hypothetical protein QN277_010610 [Acacia crassicarpa]|uniref:AB hydrolase-1 domain-containing protein n=1 Tax=Acacia crassicarpa TaxID=499986 RepID=A0AAE1MB87_9FABA|nr:hypothetical protein QN277_010610 [Acacia crassicarpa]
MGTSILDALNVRVEGSSDRVLVLAHGFGTDQSAWQRILPYFTRRYTVILFDLICAGSVNPDHFDFRRYTILDAYVDDLLDILENKAGAFVGFGFINMDLSCTCMPQLQQFQSNKRS